jgi:hypothetical protein
MATGRRRPRRPAQQPAAGPAAEETGQEPATPQEPVQPAARGTSAGRSGPPEGRSARFPAAAGSAVDTGAGFVLGLLFWGWVGLPFLRGGPAEVKKTLMAKWLNKAPDGSWLP